MICKLCEKEIAKYNQEFNSLDIAGKRMDLCRDCIDAIIKWQGKTIAKLFPTKMMKKLR